MSWFRRHFPFRSNHPTMLENFWEVPNNEWVNITSMLLLLYFCCLNGRLVEGHFTFQRKPKAKKCSTKCLLTSHTVLPYNVRVRSKGNCRWVTKRKPSAETVNLQYCKPLYSTDCVLFLIENTVKTGWKNASHVVTYAKVIKHEKCL